SVAISPDGRLVASGGGGVRDGDSFLTGKDHEIRLWDLSPLSSSATSAQATAFRRWLAPGLMMSLFLSLCCLGTWFYVHHGRRPPSAREPDPIPDNQAKSVPPSVSVPCPGCGTFLRAKSAFAGKKAKCPKCGEQVLLPEVAS